MSKRVVAIVGSYRKGATVETLVDAILAGAREQGAVTQTIHLRERHLEFCTNCRTCTQTEGEERGPCPQNDDLNAILSAVEAADALVLASPVNYYNVTALFRRFMERLTGYAYWPWGQRTGPKPRTRATPRKALLVATTAMPGFLIPIATGAPRALKLTAKVLGAQVTGSLWMGLAASQPSALPSAKPLSRARLLGRQLVQ
jgi:putative NADPH-quinone reductase